MSKKVLAIFLSAVMTLSLAACGNGNKSASKDIDEETIQYADIEVGKDYTDIKTTIHFYNSRTDMEKSDYSGKQWKDYVADFNKLYPNITVEVETDSAYADNALIRLQGGDWGDIMYIPAVDKSDLSTYFLSYGDLDTMKEEIKYATAWEYDGQEYGIPCDGTANGIVYNKAVFKAAGIDALPTTPEELLKDLQLIKDNTQAIPLYTNYAAGWTMGAWDAYIGGAATGETDYMNQTLIHTAAPFTDPGDGTHAYNVYKILYDAVANGLTEDDYSTTDWEGSKAMLNNGEIGCMVLGSWAFSQIKQAGDQPDDVGYMPFPITIDGKQYATTAGDYSYCINVDSSSDNQKAAMVFVKWMTEESGYAMNEGGITVDKDNDELPDTYAEFESVEFIEDQPAVSGEEDFFNMLNADSELMVNTGGNQKVQSIIEHAANGDKTFDDIMSEWNKAWSDAQETNGIEQKY